jgi:N-acetyl-D-muramate 6-phosphate phosphatase
MRDEKIVLGGLDLKRVEGLLFDVDGTLSDTDDHLVDRIDRRLKLISFLFRNRDSRLFSRWIVMAMETPLNFFYGLADRLGVDGLLLSFYSWLTRKRKTTIPLHERFWIIPGVKGMLERFVEHYPMAVVSARDAESTIAFLEHSELMSYFKVVVTAQTCEHTKPYPDPVIYAANQLGLEPEACLMIGDTIMDVKAGKMAGTQTVAVLCGFGTQRELKRAGADLILSETLDIEKIIAGDRNVTQNQIERI